MAVQLQFFPVGNGDMTLIKTDTGKTVLIDCNIRKAADDDSEDEFDAASALKDALERDFEGRYHLDGMVLSHPDKDHCSGLETHFHLEAPDDWSEKDDKIIIDTMLSSPIVFRRMNDGESLCDDAKAWRKEAKRRVNLHKKSGVQSTAGQAILILGEDIDGKTDELEEILVKVGETFSELRGEDAGFDARLIGPVPDDEVGDDEKEKLSKNNSSVIMNVSLHAEGVSDATKFLTGGDAEVEVWKQVWVREGATPETLEYDVLQAPHHCSWRSLSEESWSESNGTATVDDEAYAALSQARTGAIVVSSSKPVKSDDSDPPCIGAKETYEDMTNVDDFLCTGEHPTESDPDVLIIEVFADGWRKLTTKISTVSALGLGSVAATPRRHG